MTGSAIDLDHASDQLRELVEEATRAGEVLLTRGGEAVAKVVPVPGPRGPRRPGSARGTVHVAEDFDATSEDFRDHVQGSWRCSSTPTRSPGSSPTTRD
jgi:antitoxin (DNA-binding transcriptional repressor) of toxin-antitoxin stability system